MQYTYKPRGKRNTNRRLDLIATISPYRYKAMMRALVDRTRAQIESAKATDDIDQSGGKSNLV